MGWAAVWLLAPWLARRRWFGGLLLALGIMLAMGVLAYFVIYGIGATDDPPFFLITYGAASVALVLGMTISGRCCRRHGRLGLFMAWLFLWTVLGGIGTLLLLVVPLIMFMSGGAFELLIILSVVVSSFMMGGIFSVAVYLTNVPFMVLAFRNSLYRERLHSVLRMPAPAAVGASPFAEGGPVTEQPTSDEAAEGAREQDAATDAVQDASATQQLEQPGPSPVA
jgi:hypothetical protein